MARLRAGWASSLLVIALLLLVLPGKAAAFGAGNIPSIAQVEGTNWRHGDIEDMLKTVAFIHGKKWTTLMISRVYFGNWLRDYSQAVDVGSLKGANAATIRILVWVLSFLSHGYATAEFEVTDERLGVYRPEEHIDNPLGYADGDDARKFDARLRGPVDPRELDIDPRTGMKNYIKNEDGGWATSAGYLRFSIGRSAHFGRTHLHGSPGEKGKEAHLCEALRCLGQTLHCLEDFSAHSNYCELALRELGYHDVYPHCGIDTQIYLAGKRVYPIVTGTFGAVDFLHSVLGEANDHFTQAEVDELDVALKNAEHSPGGPSASSEHGFFDFGSSSKGGDDFISLVSKVPGIGGDFASQARDLKAGSVAQEEHNRRAGYGPAGYRATRAGNNQNIVPGMSPDFDPVKLAKQIYPILEFRDRIVKGIHNVIARIPGLESLMEHISETLSAFVLGLLAPFIRPIIEQVSKALKDGSSVVISSSAQAQLEPWNDRRCDNPTHSMLSKDHFTNVLNSCAGRVAAAVLQYAVPRILYAWENPGVPVDEVVNDILRALHHPAARDERGVEIQRIMFATVQRWAAETPLRPRLAELLSSDSVRAGRNHILANGAGAAGHDLAASGGLAGAGCAGHGKPTGSLWGQIRARDAHAMAQGGDGQYEGARVSYSATAEAQQMVPSTTGEAASYYSAAGPSPSQRPEHEHHHQNQHHGSHHPQAGGSHQLHDHSYNQQQHQQQQHQHGYGSAPPPSLSAPPPQDGWSYGPGWYEGQGGYPGGPSQQPQYGHPGGPPPPPQQPQYAPQYGGGPPPPYGQPPYGGQPPYPPY